MEYDVIIIGAGAAGLMAMKDMLEAGYRVCLLEAGAIAGGRILTLTESGFDQPADEGAEFVHGKLPLTLELLNKAGIEYLPVEGKMISVQKEKWQEDEEHDSHWGALMHQLGKLKTDMSIAAFLEQFFSADKYTRLRGAVRRFAEGFDLADITKASAMAAQREWSHENETQYRIPGGYIQLIDFLRTACEHENAAIHYNTSAATIAYSKEKVRVHTTDNQIFEAPKMLLTVSAGVLQSGELEFIPALKAHAHAIQQLGFGHVVKILLQFKTPFWRMREPDIGFILSDEPVPTWWTQLPLKTNLLTGWLGGPAAAAMANETGASLLQTALSSLSAIFHLPLENIQQQLVHYKISSWQQQPNIKGGYSYVTVDSVNAKKIMAHPVEGVIFFAGEAVYNGESQGTVEAALQSGREVARTMIMAAKNA